MITISLNNALTQKGSNLKKLIVAMLCAVMSAQFATAMEQESKLEEKTWKKLPQDIGTQIVQLYIVSQYDGCKSINHVPAQMREFCCLNKSTHNFLNNPQTIRIIINKHIPVGKDIRPYVMATQFGTRGSKKYINKSTQLHNELTSDSFSPSKIDELISAGADINCYPPNTDPILFKVLGNQEKLQRALQLGANVNAVNQDQKTPLACAIAKRILPAINLLLSYNPQDQCVSTAVQKNSRSVVKSLIKNGNLTSEQITQGLTQSISEQKKELIPLFLQANPETCQLLNLSLQFMEQSKIITKDTQKQKSSLAILEALYACAPEDLPKIKKSCHRITTSSELAHSMVERGLYIVAEKNNDVK